jgi:hypothetical protein
MLAMTKQQHRRGGRAWGRRDEGNNCGDLVCASVVRPNYLKRGVYMELVAAEIVLSDEHRLRHGRRPQPAFNH